MADVIDALIAEAFGEGPEGIAAVAHVIQQRALAEGKTPEQIVNEAGQFSGVANPGRVVAQSMQDPAIRQQVGEIWSGVQSGSIPNPYPGATHFHTPAVSPSWSNSFERLGQHGNHIFYSDGTPVASPAAPKRVEPSMPETRPAATATAAIEQAAPSSTPSRDYMALGEKLVGMGEVPNNAQIQEYLRNGGQNLDPATTAWCAAFVNATLGQAGIEGTGSLAARSFLNYGTETKNPQRGDLAVFWRESPDSWKGHVGFFDRINPDGTIRVLGGNQDNSVSYADYGADQLLGYRQVPGASGTSAMAYAPGTQPAVMRAPGKGNFWAPLTGPIRAGLAATGIQPTVMRAANRAMPSNIFQVPMPIRNAVMSQMMQQNIGSAPTVTQGHGGAGTRAYAVTSGGSAPVMLASQQSSGGNSPQDDGRNPAGQNMDIYRANAAVLGGNGFTQSNIDRALSSGKTLYKLA